MTLYRHILPPPFEVFEMTEETINESSTWPEWLWAYNPIVHYEDKRIVKVEIPRCYFTIAPGIVVVNYPSGLATIKKEDFMDRFEPVPESA